MLIEIWLVVISGTASRLTCGQASIEIDLRPSQNAENDKQDRSKHDDESLPQTEFKCTFKH